MSITVARKSFRQYLERFCNLVVSIVQEGTKIFNLYVEVQLLPVKFRQKTNAEKLTMDSRNCNHCSRL